MTITKTFPLNSARIDDSKYQEERLDPAMRATTEGGYVVTRPRYTRRPRRVWKIGFTNISDADKAALETFWNSVRGGSEAFNWTLPVTGEQVVVRFAEGTKLGFSYAGPLALEDGTLAGRWNTTDLSLEEV